jgi:hypothetical protein
MRLPLKASLSLAAGGGHFIFIKKSSPLQALFGFFTKSYFSGSVERCH